MGCGARLPRDRVVRYSMRMVNILTVSGILALALLLRLWGVTFGFPFVYHYDEPSQVNLALGLGRGQVSGIRTTTGFANTLFPQYAVWFALDEVVEKSGLPTDLSTVWETYPTFDLILLGRVTSAFAGTITVALVYRLARRARGQVCGYLAALVAAVAFLHVRNSHYARPDILVSSLVTASVLAAAAATSDRSARLLFVSGALAGFAVACKWTALPVLIPVVLAGAMIDLPVGLGRLKVGRIALGFLVSAGFLVGFAIGGLEVLFDPQFYLQFLLLQLRHVSERAFWIWQVDTVSGWLFYVKTLSYGIGVIPLAAATVGLLRRGWDVARGGDRTGALILAFVLPYYVGMGWTRHYFARYVIPLIPFLALFAAEGTHAVSRWVASLINVDRAWTVAALAGLVLAQPVAASIRHDVLLTRPDTRTITKEWIEAQIPQGAKFAVDWPVYSPPLSRDQFTVKELGGVGLAGHSLDWYRQQEFDYLVTSSFVHDLSLIDERQAALRADFYAQLARELELVREFSPYSGPKAPRMEFEDIYGPATDLWQRERPGPVLRLYRVK